jgi:hypothetical protein
MLIKAFLEQTPMIKIKGVLSDLFQSRSREDCTWQPHIQSLYGEALKITREIWRKIM